MRNRPVSPQIRLSVCLQAMMVPPLLRLPELQAPRESSCLMIFICHHVVPAGTKRHPTSQAPFSAQDDGGEQE